jgi:hypothetical protein
VLKKAGIVVAVAATGLFAVSSFAFADETINKDNNSTTCSFGQATGDTTGTQSGGNALIALVNAAVNATVPVAAQAPILDCNNVELEDTLDLVTVNPSSDSAEINEDD